MKLEQARRFADSICLLLSEYCTEVRIAGSIRREMPEVKDIEIVALPRKISQQTDLFSQPGPEVIMPGFRSVLEAIRKPGTVFKGKPDGKYMMIELSPVAKLDLFMPDPDDYFRQLAIRTGPAEYSHKVIARAWTKLGWCGSDKGLRRQKDCTLRTSDLKWICVNPEGELPPAWKSEEAFFDWIGVKWVEPKLRQWQ